MEWEKEGKKMNLGTESWGKYVKSSKEERLTERDKLQRQTDMAFRELISSPPPSTAQLMAWQ